MESVSEKVLVDLYIFYIDGNPLWAIQELYTGVLYLKMVSHIKSGRKKRLSKSIILKEIKEYRYDIFNLTNYILKDNYIGIMNYCRHIGTIEISRDDIIKAMKKRK